MHTHTHEHSHAHAHSHTHPWALLHPLLVRPFLTHSCPVAPAASRPLQDQASAAEPPSPGNPSQAPTPQLCLPLGGEGPYREQSGTGEGLPRTCEWTSLSVASPLFFTSFLFIASRTSSPFYNQLTFLAFKESASHSIDDAGQADVLRVVGEGWVQKHGLGCSVLTCAYKIQ